MKRTLILASLITLFSLPAFAATHSQTFLLPTDLRVGETLLPAGHCVVTWSDPTGDQVQLSIKTEDKKTFTIPARVIQEKQTLSTIETFVSNGITYLHEIKTPKIQFVIQEVPGDLK